ncbi:MAG TPA: serine hydrolase [Flavobacteriaceae bacterium]|nr:serine hydrolase [Flavobacteriaceae bacterium]
MKYKSTIKPILNLFFFIGLLFGGISIASAQNPLTNKQIDSLVSKTMETFNVPGVAVAVIKDGEMVHLEGYGVRSAEKGGKVDENTLFGVASNTKAFTSAAIAKLVDQGKITWDTKVTEIIPEFQLASPYLTNEITVRDLLSHRTGLGLGAGDLMVFPANNTLTEDELIHNLRYLEPVSSLRSEFHYNNLMFLVAGEIVERVSGMPYEKFIKENFMNPLEMDRTVVNYKNSKDHSNEITGHVPVDGKLLPVGLSFTDPANSAAGIWSSAADMSKWVEAQLHHGKYGENLSDSLFSKKAQHEMWQMQTIIPRGGKGPYNTHFSGYGLGWFVSDVNGYKEVTHSGGLLGIVTKVLMIPELNLGIIVLTNQQSGAAFSAIANSIKDGYLGVEPRDWNSLYQNAMAKREEDAQKVVDAAWQTMRENKTVASLDNYTGTFNDPWFGNISIFKKNGKLYFRAENAKGLTGELFYYKGNTFIIKWDDRSLLADAFISFNLNKDGKAKSATVEAVSPMTDFSFDFQDLEFTRNEK